jgi:NAD(P)-dependent dehydrogenase (short-subunit alcohol dehydrogenase family)
MARTALITGASRGIGKGIALGLARAGFDLILNYRANAEAAESAKKECHALSADIHVATFQADIAKTEERKSLIDFARDEFPRLDLLVNNAGVAPEVRADLLEETEESFDRLQRINLKSPYFLTQLVSRWMIEERQRRPADYHPSIITISSVSAYTASVNRGSYCVSKAGLSMLTALYAARLAEYGINVYEIRPGIIATDMTSGVSAKYDKLIAEGLTPIPRWGTPEDVGKAVAAIAEGSFPFSTGEVINVDGGFHQRRL